LRNSFRGNEQQGNLRNCSRLKEWLLGNGELASLAYGSLKELHKFAELILRNRGRTVVHLGGFRADFCPLFWPSFLGFLRSSICRYIGVFWIWGVGRDPFSDHFWTVLLSVFSDTWKSDYASCRTKNRRTLLCPSRIRLPIR
jgi:hypothetical protein